MVRIASREQLVDAWHPTPRPNGGLRKKKKITDLVDEMIVSGTIEITVEGKVT